MATNSGACLTTMDVQRNMIYTKEKIKRKETIKNFYCDNYYNSLNLLEVLQGQEIFACGTRKSLPKAMKSDKLLKRRKADIMISYIDITVFKWKDNRIVGVHILHPGEKIAMEPCGFYVLPSLV
ncbi:transposase is4 [Holotrichia oblita]|uniref:Transposase is4 n=1 Tax=Holotrichia oblita TaxID=644536 RepID=A0ACB9TMU4_HOLOL|nr:transposase is4 [Holotrichia oblita]